MSATSATPFPLGAYLGNPNGSDATAEATFKASYDSFVSTMGAAPEYIDSYIDYTQPVADWVSNTSWQAWSNAQSPNAQGLIPVIGLPMASIASGSMTPDQQFQAFASGQYDSVLQGIVQAWLQQGFTNLVFRPGWEMNIAGPTYAGDIAQDQADWVAAFQHIYTVLHAAGVADGVNVTVVWNPSATNYSNAEATTNLYPGNGYVDVIGADVYSNIYPYSDGTNAAGQATYHDWDSGQEDTSTAQFIADPVNREHYWSEPASTKWSSDGSGGHSQSFDSILQFAKQQGKPFAVPETGAGNSDAGTDVSDDAAFPAWLSQQLTAAQSAGETIDFVNIWDSNGGGNYEFSFASDDKPQEAAAWAQSFGAQASVSATTSSTSSSGGSIGVGLLPVSTGSDLFDWIGGSGAAWGAGSSWQDLSTGQDPVSSAPGAGNAVTIDGTQTGTPLVITGSGNAASTTIAGQVQLVGSFGLGAVTLGSVGAEAWLSLSTVSGSASATASTLTVIDGTFALAGNGAALSASGAIALAADGMLSITQGAALQAASLTLSGAAVAVDAASSVELGEAGDATVGDLTVNIGATLTGAGSVAATVVVNGELVAVGGTLAVGTLLGSGTVAIASGATLSVARQIGPGLAISFADATGTLELDANEALSGSISGFVQGDTIGIAADAVLTGGVFTANAGGGTLALSDGAIQVAAIDFIGDFTGESFQVTPGGSGGALITLIETPTVIGGTGTPGEGSTTVSGGTGTSGDGTTTVTDGTGTSGDGTTTASGSGTSDAGGTSSESRGAGSTAGSAGASSGGGITTVSTSPSATSSGSVVTVLSTAAYTAQGMSELQGALAALAAAGGTTLVALTPGDTAPAASAGQANVALITPGAGMTVALPSGYTAVLLQGGLGATLTDGGEGGVLLGGNDGNDTLVANGAGDTIVAGNGANVVSAAASTIVVGGNGNDTVVLNAGANQVTTGTGDNTLFLGSGTDLVMSAGQDTIVASSGNDTVFGSSNAVFFGGAGPLVYVAQGGAPTVVGGQGSTIVFGSNQNGGVVFGGAGPTTYVAGNGTSVYIGGSGKSVVFEGANGGVIYGGSGPGTFVANGNSIVEAGDGPSTIVGGPGDQIYLVGGASNCVFAGSGNSTLTSASSTGNNTFIEGGGGEQITGGTGNDVFVVSSGSATVGGGGGGNLYIAYDGAAGGTEIISDFNPAQDRIGLYGYAGDANAAALASAQVKGGATTLTLSDGTRFVLQGVAGLGTGSFL